MYLFGLHPWLFAAWLGCILAALLCIFYGIYWWYKSKGKSKKVSEGGKK